MPKIQSKKKKVSADDLSKLADANYDVTEFYSSGAMKPGFNKIELMPSVQRVNVDFALPMLEEIDAISTELHITRQSLIKTWVRDSLDRYYQNKKNRMGT
jgi:hypothetical protein